MLRELKFLPIHGRKLFEYYRDFVAHKEVYFQNVQAEIECLGDRSCFTEEQAGELLPIFQERLALYDVKRAAAYYLAIHGSFSGTINSFGVKGLDVERFLKLFPPVSARLKDVPLENKNALQLIRERDKKGSLIYTDPPYVKTERLYRIAGKLGRFRRFLVRLWQILSGELQSGAGNGESFIVRIMVQIEFHAVFLLGGYFGIWTSFSSHSPNGSSKRFIWLVM